jgi:hypothetical protein
LYIKKVPEPVPVVPVVRYWQSRFNPSCVFNTVDGLVTEHPVLNFNATPLSAYGKLDIKEITPAEYAAAKSTKSPVRNCNECGNYTCEDFGNGGTTDTCEEWVVPTPRSRQLLEEHIAAKSPAAKVIEPLAVFDRRDFDERAFAKINEIVAWINAKGAV